MPNHAHFIGHMYVDKPLVISSDSRVNIARSLELPFGPVENMCRHMLGTVGILSYYIRSFSD